MAENKGIKVPCVARNVEEYILATLSSGDRRRSCKGRGGRNRRRRRQESLSLGSESGLTLRTQAGRRQAGREGGHPTSEGPTPIPSIFRIRMTNTFLRLGSEEGIRSGWRRKYSGPRMTYLLGSCQPLPHPTVYYIVSHTMLRRACFHA